MAAALNKNELELLYTYVCISTFPACYRECIEMEGGKKSVGRG